MELFEDHLPVANIQMTPVEQGRLRRELFRLREESTHESGYFPTVEALIDVLYDEDDDEDEDEDDDPRT